MLQHRLVTTGRSGLGLVLAAALATPGLAGDAESWTFDLETEGEDVFWTSPTAVANDAPRYDLQYELTTFDVTVSWSIFEFTLDQIENIPEDLRVGGAIVDGPPPVVLFQGDVVFPDPPEPAAFAGTLEIGLDGDGFGRFSMTDMTFGTFDVEIPPFGMQTVQLEAIHVAGTLSVDPLGPPGDVNGDGDVSFADLVLVLSAWGPCPDPPGECPEDVDGDGTVGFTDLVLVLSNWTA